MTDKAWMAVGVVVGVMIVSVPAGLALFRSPPGRADRQELVVADSSTVPPEASPTPDTGAPADEPRPTEPEPPEPAPSPGAEPSPVPTPDDARRPESAPAGTPVAEAPTSSRPAAGRTAKRNVPPGLPELPTTPPRGVAMTPLAGRHTGELVLRADRSPYELTGRCEVLGHLEIEPGVLLWLRTGKNPGGKLIVQGTVRAIGRADKPIVFAAEGDSGQAAPPVILESPAVGRPEAPEGWDIQYVGLANCSAMATMRSGKTTLRFCRVRGEVRIESSAGTILLADSWFPSAHDLVLSGAAVTLERVIVAGLKEADTKKFLLLTADRLEIEDSRLHAEMLRLTNGSREKTFLSLTDSIVSSHLLTLALGKGVSPRISNNSFYLVYRPQVVGPPSEHPHGVGLRENYWQITAVDAKWPYNPKTSAEKEILTVRDQPRLDKPIGGYLWKAATDNQ